MEDLTRQGEFEQVADADLQIEGIDGTGHHVGGTGLDPRPPQGGGGPEQQDRRAGMSIVTAQVPDHGRTIDPAMGIVHHDDEIGRVKQLVARGGLRPGDEPDGAIEASEIQDEMDGRGGADDGDEGRSRFYGCGHGRHQDTVSPDHRKPRRLPDDPEDGTQLGQTAMDARSIAGRPDTRLINGNCG